MGDHPPQQPQCQHRPVGRQHDEAAKSPDSGPSQPESRAPAACAGHERSSGATPCVKKPCIASAPPARARSAFERSTAPSRPLGEAALRAIREGVTVRKRRNSGSVPTLGYRPDVGLATVARLANSPWIKSDRAETGAAGTDARSSDAPNTRGIQASGDAADGPAPPVLGDGRLCPRAVGVGRYFLPALAFSAFRCALYFLISAFGTLR